MHAAATQIPLFPEHDETEEPTGISIRESGRAKRLSIKVYPRGKVEVVVPRCTRARDVQAFVEEHRDWIKSTRAAFSERHTPEPFRLPARISLPGIERTIGVSYQPADDSRSVRFRLKGDILFLSGKTTDSSLCVAAIKRWLASTARTYFEPQLQALSRLTGNPYKRMRVAGQKTCWGSHSSTGTISINYCLLFLPPALVRYLMIHELSHARHMDHSRRFWAEVRRFEPDYRRLDKRLADAWQAIPTWVGIY